MERVSRRKCAAATNKLELGNIIQPAASEGTILNPKSGVLCSMGCIPRFIAKYIIFFKKKSQN